LVSIQTKIFQVKRSCN